MSDSATRNSKDIMYAPDSCEDGDDEDIWDDRKLNDAYDKALKIANAEVAKRIAMSTNTQQKPKQAEAKKGKSSTKCKKNSCNWKSGMPCRALYELDGIEYEALILRIISDKECLVRFLGYENSEIVAIDTLKPSLGKEARNQQIEQALEDNYSEDCANQSSCGEYADNITERLSSPQSTEKSFTGHKKAKKKKKAQKPHPLPDFDLPQVPFQMPNMNFIRNGGAGMPLPPPPPLPMGNDAEDDGLSSMLISWYMSGYYTGLYQGIRRGQQSAKKEKL